MTAVWITLAAIGGAVTWAVFADLLAWLSPRPSRTGSLDDFRHITNHQQEEAP